jgi:hypothetical protein
MLALLWVAEPKTGSKRCHTLRHDGVESGMSVSFAMDTMTLWHDWSEHLRGLTTQTRMLKHRKVAPR